MKYKSNLLLCLIVVLLFNLPLMAQHHHGDVFLQVVDDHIETGLVEEGVTSPVYVFGSEFGETGIPEFTDEPGFDSEPGTFNPDTRLGWNAVAGFQVWNGNGFEPTGGETLQISFETLEFVVGDDPIQGFDIAVQPDGGFHRHLNFLLLGSGNSPDIGVYLLNLEMYSTDPLVENSEPFWIVFNYQEEETEHEAAIHWVEENLAPEHCHADLTGDETVNIDDVFAVLGLWGACPDPCPPHCPGDLTDDCVVNIDDIFHILGEWGPCH